MSEPTLHTPTHQVIETTCCIAGGGPAGLMLGYLLARAGVGVVVLEKHGDFLRDFRGDTIHPSTLELMHELGLLEAFLALPHDEMSKLELVFNGQRLAGPDFSHLPTRCKFIAFMPQWDFLNFLTAQAQKLPAFQLHMRAEVNDLIFDSATPDARITGLRATTPNGSIEVRAHLVVAADGRASNVRSLASLTPTDFGIPIDVLWLRIAKRGQDIRSTLAHINNGRMLITIDRGDYWQCAYVIAKGAFPALQARGLNAFKTGIAETVPETTAGLAELTSWDQVFLLSVQVNRLAAWYREGLLCIGDAAHAMSPAAGVGINLAIQDAVAASNLLTEKLRQRAVVGADLQRVQQRREFAVRVTQRMQIFAHRRLLSPGKDGVPGFQPPRAARVMIRLLAPLLRRLAARFVGMGIRTERIETKAQASPSA